jgi:hypothetical protein
MVAECRVAHKASPSESPENAQAGAPAGPPHGPFRRHVGAPTPVEFSPSRRAGFDPLSPSVGFSARRGLYEPVANRPVVVPASHQNGRVPRRNNTHREEKRQAEGAHRVASLGSHWRADGLPKTAYASQGDALTAALIRRQESGVELNVYRCDVCSAWHMGNPHRREPNSDRRK